MRRSHWLISGLAVGALCLGSVGSLGCDDGTGGEGGSAATGGGVQPPARPSSPKPGDGSGKKSIAVTKITLGTASNTAWQELGYDLDNKVTTASNVADHCTPNSNGSAKTVFPDGKDGRDNSFGKNLIPIIKSAAGSTDLEGSLNGAIAEGSFTIIVDLPDLGPEKNYDPLKAYLLGGKNGTPMGTPTTWELVPELLTGTTPDSAKVKFATSYLTDNTWVSGEKGTVNLSLAIAGFSINLGINSALLSMKLDDAHNKATSGVIAGVLKTEDFITELKKVVGAFSQDLCMGQAVESILNQIRQASDIMADGSNGAGKTCDGISIGLGFEAASTTLGAVGAPAEPQPDPCLATSSSSGGGTTSSSSGSGSSGSGN